jgi:hypothetical protein
MLGYNESGIFSYPLISRKKKKRLFPSQQLIILRLKCLDIKDCESSSQIKQLTYCLSLVKKSFKGKNHSTFLLLNCKFDQIIHFVKIDL